jgi:hypothetical protein
MKTLRTNDADLIRNTSLPELQDVLQTRKDLRMLSNATCDTTSSPGRKSSLHLEFREDPIAEPTAFAAQGAKERAKESGPGAEIVRRVFAEDLRGAFDAFLETASTVEILTLREVFEFKSSQYARPELGGQCPLVEAFLGMLGLDPETVLSTNIQKAPIRRGP